MPTQTHLNPRLAPLAYAYAGIMALRRKAWEQGVFKSTKTPCPCISVGNIAWGGTGKTPLVAWLMQWAVHHNLTPAVLSRGYKTKIKNPPLHVQAQHKAEEVGDEPLMLTLNCPKGHVFVDPNRQRAASFAMHTIKPDIFILDDGMQHIALKRDLELITMRPKDLQSQWNKVIPQGTWREGAKALTVADAFLIKVPPSTLPQLEQDIVQKLEPFKRPVFTYHLIPTGLEPFSRLNNDGVDLRPHQSPYAFMAGIGTPQQAISTVTDFMGAPPDSLHTYPDHHNFTVNELADIKKLGMPVICTSKDAARLRHKTLEFPLFVLNVAVQFGKPFMTADTFPSWLTAWWEQHITNKT